LGLIFGSILALVLFIVAILSYKRPDVLLSAVGVAETSPSPIPTPKQDAATPHPENIISYANYTRFPLDPLEYKAECHKLMGEVMGAMEFWSGEEDVVHHDEVDPGPYPAPEGLRTQICSKTITYMLDGHVGLLADIALMTQAAALAREVSSLVLSSTFTLIYLNYAGRQNLSCRRHLLESRKVCNPSFGAVNSNLKSTEDGQTTSRTFAHANQGLNHNAARHLRRVKFHFTSTK
jgi:hypothetical protein